MTYLEQLQSYQLNDLFYETLKRVCDFSLVPEGYPPYELESLQTEEDTRSLYERTIMHESLSKPSLEDIQIEFEILKAELIAEEQARLDEIARREALQARIDVLDDFRVAARRAGLEEANMALVAKRIIDENDLDTINVLETADAQILSEQAQEQVMATENKLRADRDEKLYQSDWTQLADAPLTTAQKTEYREYRQYLRDVPALWAQERMLEPIVLEFSDWQPVKEQYRML